ncbi:MAG: EamA family transporter [Gemmatimonadaceae bacterium]
MASTLDKSETPGHAQTRPGVWLTEAALVLMALIWGVNFSVVKFGTTLVEPLAYNGVRVTLAAVLLLAIVSVSSLPFPPRKTILSLMALGVLGNGVYQFFFVEGIARASASDSALVVAASPAFIAIIGRMRGVEHIQRRVVMGIALSIAGIAFVVIGTASDPRGASTLLGDLLVLCGSLAWAVYTVLLQPHTERVPGLQLSAFTMAGGALMLLVVASPALLRTNWHAVPPLAWAAIAYSGFFALVIAYLFWYQGVRVIGPTRTAVFSNLQPVVAMLVAWMALGEKPTPWQIVGAAAIMGGLLLTRS